MIYNRQANTYSLKHNKHSPILTPLPPPRLHNIKLGKKSEKSLYKSETQDECGTSKSKPQISLPMVKPNTSEEVNPLCPMTPIPSHASDVEFMHELTLGTSCPVNHLCECSPVNLVNP